MPVKIEFIFISGKQNQSLEWRSVESSIEFSLNYTKLATLAIKAYVGKNKINSAKKVTSSGD